MTQERTSPLLEQVKRLRAQQAAMEGAELERLVRAYARIDRAGRDPAELLAIQIMEKYGGGMAPTANQIRRLSRYRDMLETVGGELDRYKSFMEVEIGS